VRILFRNSPYFDANNAPVAPTWLVALLHLFACAVIDSKAITNIQHLIQAFHIIEVSHSIELRPWQRALEELKRNIWKIGRALENSPFPDLATFSFRPSEDFFLPPFLIPLLDQYAHLRAGRPGVPVGETFSPANAALFVPDILANIGPGRWNIAQVIRNMSYGHPSNTLPTGPGILVLSFFMRPLVLRVMASPDVEDRYHPYGRLKRHLNRLVLEQERDLPAAITWLQPLSLYDWRSHAYGREDLRGAVIITNENVFRNDTNQKFYPVARTTGVHHYTTNQHSRIDTATTVFCGSSDLVVNPQVFFTLSFLVLMLCGLLFFPKKVLHLPLPSPCFPLLPSLFPLPPSLSSPSLFLSPFPLSSPFPCFPFPQITKDDIQGKIKNFQKRKTCLQIWYPFQF
jgi:hypothetical protein